MKPLDSQSIPDQAISMHSQVLALLARLVLDVSAQGASYEADQIASICGATSTYELASELDYIAGGLVEVEAAATALRVKNVIVNLPCKGAPYRWESRE